MTEDSSLGNSKPMNLLSTRDRLLLEARLQHRRQREQEGRRSERTEVRQARLARRPVHGEESARSGSPPQCSTFSSIVTCYKPLVGKVRAI